MGKKGHCFISLTAVLALIAAIMAIVALFTTWWNLDGGSPEFTLWKMTFEYGADNYVDAKHDDMCKNSRGPLMDYCAKIRATRATCLMTTIWGFLQALIALCEFCKPRCCTLVAALIIGWFLMGSSVSAGSIGTVLQSDNLLLNSAGPAYILIWIAAFLSFVGYVLLIIGACLGPKGGGGGGCKGGCNFCPDGGSTGSAYGGHQRFRDRPPVGGAPQSGGWRPPMSGMGMRPPMRPQPQMVPYQVPVPVPVSAPPPPQQINLNIRASGPVSGLYGSQPPPQAIQYSAGPPPSGGDDFGLDRRV
mmetsp:Transcript_11919/g.18855  ORF Transcript_11919/g.18855 Transcript_11919/m.18855 type:complete len:303 (-) Transcript_11919:61-969(-)